MTLARRLAAALLLALTAQSPAVATQAPLFDAHVHYRDTMADAVPPQDAARHLAEAGVDGALILATDATTFRRLSDASGAHLFPFLDLSRRLGRKTDWMHAEDLVQRARQALAAEGGVEWDGIGELHIRAKDRFAPAFEALLHLAAERGLPLMIHGDPAVIDHAYTVEPEVRIIWAHAGTYAYPPLLDDYLTRHPNLMADLSMRNPTLTDDEGRLREAWFELLTRHADRFLVGMDTFSVNRWTEYGRIVAATRGWLADLPPEVADALGCENARRLFPKRQEVVD
jgi:predicted TIM-barrel fold metal-dependent hydrolase